MKTSFVKKIKKYQFLILVFASINPLFAQKNYEKTQKSAATFYYSLTSSNSALKNYYQLNKNENNTQNYVFNFVKGGWVYISSKAGKNTVLGFSEKGEYKIEGSPLEKVLGNNYQKTLASKKVSLTFTTKPKLFSRNNLTNVDPFMTSVWGGVNCFDNNGNVVYAGNYFTPSHSSPGCVAISMSQVLYFYKWPLKGMGSNVYSDNYSGTLKRHAMFFDNITYDWGNMLTEYQGVSSTNIQRKAMGELLYSSAIALGMNFEPTGSTSNINKTPFVYKNFYRFTSHYQDENWNSFWDRLYENIQDGLPVPIAVDASRTGDGHVFIANGYQEINGQPYYYLNWGWYNDNGINAWYNIQAWTDASPGYNRITGASFDVLPNPQIMSIENTGNGNDFKINWEVSSKITPDEYTLEQKKNQSSWTEIATGITEKNYTVTNPTGTVYQFRVKSKIKGNYYANSWSETEIHAVTGGYDGYASFGGSQYAYARQTPDNDLDFTGDYTFETWVRLKSNNSNGNVILDQQSVFGIEVTDVTASNYSIKFKALANSAELNSGNSGTKIPLNQWAHVAITHQGNVTQIFIDGELRQENTGANFNLPSSNNALNIAERYHGSYSGRIKADLDQIRLSSNARYTANFTPNKEEIYEVDNNTIAYFHFQGVHGVRLKDVAHHLSVIVKNESNYVEWEFETTANAILSNEDFKLFKKSLSIYPNPIVNNSAKITIDSSLNLKKISLTVFDLRGRKVPVKTANNNTNTWQLSFTNISKGIYLLQIKGDGFKATKKIIIN